MEGWLILGFIVVLFIIWSKQNAKRWAATPPDPNIVCQHCGTRGVVKVRRVNQRKGISGAKATGAVLTGGLSTAATGLSRKETVTEMTCTKCGVVSHVA